MATTRERIAQIQGRALKATVGPWKQAKMGGLIYHGKAEENTSGCFQPADDGGYVLSFDDAEDARDLEITATRLSHDLRFITAARRDVPWLCARLEGALDENERLRNACSQALAVIGSLAYGGGADPGDVARVVGLLQAAEGLVPSDRCDAPPA